MGLRPVRGEPGQFVDTDTGLSYSISEMKEDCRYDVVRWTRWTSFKVRLRRSLQELYCRIVGGSATVTVWDAQVAQMPWWRAAWTCRRRGHVLRASDFFDPGDPEDIPFEAWCARCRHFRAETLLPKDLDREIPPE